MDHLDVTKYTLRDDGHEQKAEPGSASWLTDNVWNPAVNGSGALQVYNTFAEKPVTLPQTAEAPLGSGTWMVQTVSGAAGAILPYVLAGKIAGKGLAAAGKELGVHGTAARFFASETTAQILGAGAYDLLKAPNQGETRLGNAAGSMAGFTVFEMGNKAVTRTNGLFRHNIDRIAAQSATRFGVGALGGMVSYDTSHTVSSWLGEKDDRNWNDRAKAMAAGGFINVALPAVQHGTTRLIDYGLNSRSWGAGIPIERYLNYQGWNDPELVSAAKENPLARVKTARGTEPETMANVRGNAVELAPTDGAGRLAHELRHLKVARELEPRYKQVAIQLALGDEAGAEQKYYAVRARAEAEARNAENRVNARLRGDNQAQIVDPAGMGEQRAANGKFYKDIWREEWSQFKQDKSFRPRVEYESPGAKVIALTPENVGSAETLGATVTDKGVNFAVKSSGATSMDVLIFTDPQAAQPTRILPMERTGDVWHRLGEGLPEKTLYLYRADGPWDPAQGDRFNKNLGRLDPYSKAITGDTTGPVDYDNSNPADPNRHFKMRTTENFGEMPKSVAVSDHFDWQGDKPPGTSMADTVVYEVNVRAFTAGDTTLPENVRGTYRGFIHRISHLKELGITAVELMPIHAFDKTDWPHKNPITGEQLGNDWGYNTKGYMAPEGRLAADGAQGQQVAEFKSLVRELHKAGIEVYLDVVYNHTREGNQYGPSISFKGLDNKIYYLLKPGQLDHYEDHTGCGNTMNVNHPRTIEMIMDSLRYWKQEMHVDGFRFDLATIFNYDVDGIEKAKTKILETIENDPVLKDVKLIAEPWGPDQYRVGLFNGRWYEWNDKFRDTIRRFVKSDTGVVGDVGDRIAGSTNIYGQEGPSRSFNAVAMHDGLTLNDVVEYNSKHNEGNAENNRDGNNTNYSWNCGWEGPLDGAPLSDETKAFIQSLRNRQIKNMLALTMLSRGTPMLLYGDEMRRTAFGNNNAWPQPRTNIMDWSFLDKHADINRFTKMMIELRKEHRIGHQPVSAVTWHGIEPYKPDWSNQSRFIAWELGEPGKPQSLFSAFNAHWEPVTIRLPAGRDWVRLVDTNLPAGQDIVTRANATPLETKYILQPRSGIILESTKAKPD